jgi:DNA-binding NtrC family response regulator
VSICEGSIITEDEIESEWMNNINPKYKESEVSMTDDSDDIIEPLEAIEKRAIEKALNKANGNITTTANLLKVTRNTVYNKMKKYNLDVR